MLAITRSCVLLFFISTLEFVSSQDCTLQDFIGSPLFDPNANITSLDARYSNYKQLIVNCNEGSVGFIKLTCFEGEWMSSGTRCQDILCKVTGLPDNIQADPPLQNNDQIQKGQMIRFRCTVNRYGVFLRGAEMVECLTNGQWSDEFPTCGPPQDCGRPPLLENGDTTTNVRATYNHGARVKYACQRLHKMQGDSFKTCINGRWTGEMRCLKPCTVNERLIEGHNIEFKYSSQTLLYIEHETGLSFKCKTGTRQAPGSVDLRQHCNDGVMELPTCV